MESGWDVSLLVSRGPTESSLGAGAEAAGGVADGAPSRDITHPPTAIAATVNATSTARLRELPIRFRHLHPGASTIVTSAGANSSHASLSSQQA
ncbi:hypothetical protein GCM10012319_12390 [Comamonas sp. KCTC 72670]|nr:hypothetical protein GCM10012319_12390 [Comamonas sp. KCTC 72670]